MVCIPAHVWGLWRMSGRAPGQARPSKVTPRHPVTWFRPERAERIDGAKADTCPLTCQPTQISMPLKYPSTITSTHSQTTVHTPCTSPRCSLVLLLIDWQAHRLTSLDGPIATRAYIMKEMSNCVSQLLDNMWRGDQTSWSEWSEAHWHVFLSLFYPTKW